MNDKYFNIIRSVLANFLWCLSCLPGLVAFFFASRNVKWIQSRVLRRILRDNAHTEIGKRYHFGSIRNLEDVRSIPLSEYEDYLSTIERTKTGDPAVMTTEPVKMLQPTSGSTQAAKLIPYTESLKRDFLAAINPWIASLYVTYPSLLLGRHYWSISPTTVYPNDPSSNIPIGFGDDAEYLGPIQRHMVRALSPVPLEVSRIKNVEAFDYLTLLFLLRESNLRIISVWHPSFLTLLIKKIGRYFPWLISDIEQGTISEKISVRTDLRHLLISRLTPKPTRAKELGRIDVTETAAPVRIWPTLRVISCWTDGQSASWIANLASCFPGVVIQGKGLIATEGIVSLPIGQEAQKVCAIRSHFFEFIDTQDGRIKNAWNVEKGKTYTVVLTTGGGLYRYRLHDVVRVKGFFNEAPCLSFISRDNLVSDIVGEKLNAQHVEECLRSVEKKLGLSFPFAMLAPLPPGDGSGYVSYIEAPDNSKLNYKEIASTLEDSLDNNYHYRHARRISQLQSLRVFLVSGNAAIAYRDHLLKKGMRAGDIKFMALSLETEWNTVFQGNFVV